MTGVGVGKLVCFQRRTGGAEYDARSMFAPVK